MDESDRHQSQTHDRSVPAGPFRARGGGSGIAALLKLQQGCTSREAHVEAEAIDRILSMLPPADVPSRPVVEITTGFGHAGGQRQGHARVIGPFARIEVMRPAGTESDDRLKRSGLAELDS